MKKQIGVIVPYRDEDANSINEENFKQGFRDQYENVDASTQKPLKLHFLEVWDQDEIDRWIEVWAV